MSLDEKHSIRQLLQAAPSRKNWKHPKREESGSESQGQKLVDMQKLVDRQQGMSAEEANGTVMEKQLVADETNICSARRPKCKYPVGEQVGARLNHSNMLSPKILFQPFLWMTNYNIGVQSVMLHVSYYYMNTIC